MITKLTKDEITAFVGKNADYYFTRWTPLVEGQNWIAQARSQELPENALMDALSKRGGTSFGAALGFFAIFGAAIVAVSSGLKSFTSGQ
ncbi:MAG: hypothetical protein EXS36_07310 [Pedosphaera sp.]|nr:hypothetical protein [Pedosphaera sp.]